MEIEQNFEVEISKELDDKINWLTEHYEKEIGAWLIGEITNEKIIIEDFLIPNQDVSSTSVDTSSKALVELRKEYGDKCKKIIGHFHSHNDMGANWSGTDERFMREFVAPREKAVFIVSSQKSRHRIRLEINKPFKISLDGLRYKIPYDNPEINEEMTKIIKDKCTEANYNWGEVTEVTKVNKRLTRKMINKMITFCTKSNNVYVRNLPLKLYYGLEGVFPIETEVFNLGNSEVTIQYKTKTKERAIELMKDLRTYMREDLEGVAEDLDYDDYGQRRGNEVVRNMGYYT